MKELEVIYSPVCEASGAFPGLLTEWLEILKAAMA